MCASTTPIITLCYCPRATSSIPLSLPHHIHTLPRSSMLRLPSHPPHPSLFDILPIFFNPTKVHNKLSNAVQSFSPPCTVVTNRASRMQSQIYLNFAEAMPIDGGAPVTTAVAKTYSVVTQKITNLPLRSPPIVRAEFRVKFI